MWEDKTMIEEIFNESSIENVVKSNISNLLILCFLVFLFSCLLVSLFLVNWIETKRNQLNKTRQEKKRQEKGMGGNTKTKAINKAPYYCKKRCTGSEGLLIRIWRRRPPKCSQAARNSAVESLGELGRPQG